VYSSICKGCFGKHIDQTTVFTGQDVRQRPLSLIAKWYWPMPAAVTEGWDGPSHWCRKKGYQTSWVQPWFDLLRKLQSCFTRLWNTEEHLANTCNEYCNYSTIPQKQLRLQLFHYFIFSAIFHHHFWAPEVNIGLRVQIGIYHATDLKGRPRHTVFQKIVGYYEKWWDGIT